MCDCIQVIDRKLAEAGANTKISVTFTLGTGVGMFPTIQTDKADKANRKKPMAVMPSFCPWCGLSYKTGLPAAGKEPESLLSAGAVQGGAK